MIHAISQLYKDDCGYTCLKMLLANLKKDRGYLYLKHPKLSGAYSFLELKEIASNYGVILNGYRFLKNEDLLTIHTFPFIAQIKKGELTHAVLVYKIRKNYIYFVDPLEGKKKTKLEKFYQMFANTCLIYDEVKEDKRKMSVYKFIPKKERRIQIALNALTSLTFFSFIFIISPDIPFFLPILLLMCFVIFEIIYRTYSLSLSKKFDDTYLANYLYKTEANEKSLKTIIELKTFSINAPVTFITNLASILFLLILASLSNVVFIYLFFIIFLVHLCFFFVEKRYVEPKKLQILQKESLLEIVKREDYANFERLVKELSILSEEVGKLYLLKKYIIWFLIALLAISITLAAKSFNFSELLFAYVLLFYSSESISKAFNFTSEFKNYQIAYMSFINAYFA